jgi:hypothetical protein
MTSVYQREKSSDWSVRSSTYRFSTSFSLTGISGKRPSRAARLGGWQVNGAV